MRKLNKLLLVLALLAFAGLLLQLPFVQDRLWTLLATANFKRIATTATTKFDGLRVFMCGTASPLPSDRAQACVAIITDERIILVDAGIGSAGVFSAAALPAQNITTLLLTHFHSDHLGGIYDFNLNSWVAGRRNPIRVLGPEGVERLVQGINVMYQNDRVYRVAHHGSDLLNPAAGLLLAEKIVPGVIIDEGGLKVTAFLVSHEPVSTAYGYRFDYRGRSVVVSGDTVVVDTLVNASQGADLVLHDAISLPLVQGTAQAANAVGALRYAKILNDIQSYHANTDSLASLVEGGDFNMLALYHLVPPPQNFLMEKIFKRKLPDDVIITEDGMMFELPLGSDVIEVR